MKRMDVRNGERFRYLRGPGRGNIVWTARGDEDRDERFNSVQLAEPERDIALESTK